MELLNESVWTAPRDDCPHPEWWHAADGQGTELEVTALVAAFVRALQPEYVLETGTHTGQTAHAIGLALLENGHGELETLEPDYEKCQIALRRCSYPKDLPVTVQQIKSLDFEVDRWIDFAWFDSLLDLRVLEFEHFRPWLSPGAIVGFHDTGPHKGDFGEQVAELGPTLQLPTPRGVTFLQVR